MTEQNQAAVYARALLENVVEGVTGQLSAVQRGLQADPRLQQVLGDPTVEFRDKSQRLLALLPAGASPEVQQFVQYLLSEGAIGSLGQIGAELTGLVRGGPRQVEAVVTSAVALTPQEQDELRHKLTQDAGAHLDFHFEVDPDLLGGLVVRVGDRVVDASIATRLRQLRESILGVL